MQANNLTINKFIIFANICLLSIPSFSSIALAENISNSNYYNHPAIKQVRTIYNSTENRIKQHKAIKKEKSSDNLPGISQLILYLNKLGKPLKYIVESGSDDSSLQANYYYDSLGKLRFVYITGGAANGATLKHRIYFDAKGNILFEKHETTPPGYTWPQVWPKEGLIKNPLNHFSAF